MRPQYLKPYVSLQDQHIGLTSISLRISDCLSCELSKERINTVPGEGNPNAEIMFIGEAPGFNEDKIGEPFIGRAGALLNHLLDTIGLERQDVYITNMVKCRPPKNRDPKETEIDSCNTYLDSQISIVNPTVIVTLGRFSFRKFFPDIPISKARGVTKEWNGKIIFPMYHPAAALYNPSLKPRLEHDFQKLNGLITNIEGQSKNSSAPTTIPKQLGFFDIK